MNKSKVISYAKKYWPLAAVIVIMFLGVYVRTIDYRWPYLRNIDSYNFYREMNTIVTNNGAFPGYTNLLSPPYGSGIPGTFVSPIEKPYQFMAAYSYMFFHTFSPGTELWQFLIWFPALLASLMAIPMYFIGKILYDRKAGVLAAFFIVFDFAIVSRTLGGDPDSDAIVSLLPLVVIALFLFTYKTADKLKSIANKKLIIYTIITGIVFGIWGVTWSGQWFVLWLLGGFFVVKILIEIARTRKIKQSFIGLKASLLCFIIILAIYFAIGTIAHGASFVPSSIQGPFSFGDIKGEDNRDFPNVYVSVAELQSPGGIKDIVQRVSSVDFNSSPWAIIIAPFFLMMYGIIYLVYSYIKTRKHMDTVILMLIWFLGPFLATMIAVRFSILFSAPMAICSAIFLSKIIRMAHGADKKFED